MGAFGLDLGEVESMVVEGSSPELAVDTFYSAGFSVYPNPVVDGKFTIELRNVPAGNYIAKLLNSNGQIVLTENVNMAAGVASQKKAVTIHLPKGNYFLVVTGNTSSYTYKLII